MRRTKFLASVAAVALTGAGIVPAAAAPWVKGFVVGNYEYAFRYGGRADFSRDGEIEPGVDCPRGASVCERAGSSPMSTRSSWGAPMSGSACIVRRRASIFR